MDTELKKGYVPLGPLESLARSRADASCVLWTNEVFASLVGVSTRAISRWRAAGGQIQWGTADACATSLGLHPINVWGEVWIEQDRGVIDGTDKRSLRAMDAAMDVIGAKLSEGAFTDVGRVIG